MVESSCIPLDRLSQHCAKCLRKDYQGRCKFCRELAYRALCGGNDAAWDMLVMHLWPLLRRWIYVELPEATPALAEAVGYRALSALRSRYALRPTLATNFPTFPALLNDLRRAMAQSIAQAPG